MRTFEPELRDSSAKHQAVMPINASPAHSIVNLLSVPILAVSGISRQA